MESLWQVFPFLSVQPGRKPLASACLLMASTTVSSCAIVMPRCSVAGMDAGGPSRQVCGGGGTCRGGSLLHVEFDNANAIWGCFCTAAYRRILHAGIHDGVQLRDREAAVLRRCKGRRDLLRDSKRVQTANYTRSTLLCKDIMAATHHDNH